MRFILVWMVFMAGILQSELTAQVKMPFTAQEDSLIRAMNLTISRDSIRDIMQQLENFGTRFYRASNYRQVAQWIRNKFIAVGVTNAQLDSFWLTNSAFSGWQYNVVATIPGTTKPDSIYMIGAHHDCTSDYNNRLTNAPGADDNASGVATIIEIARVMRRHNYQPSSTIKFCTFTAEEIGLVGSDTLARRARTRNERIQMMINHDMVSYCADTINQWKVKLTYYDNSPDVTNLADTCVRRFTTLGVTRTTQYNNASDSYSFTSQGYKGIFFIENFDTPYYHTVNDRVSTCNMKYAAEVTKISLAMLVSQNGTQTLVGMEEPDAAPQALTLYSNYPNPFNPSTTLRYDLAEPATVTLRIYNTLGKEVRTLVNTHQPSGEYRILWDGKDHSGNAVASGVYIYRLQAGRFTQARKMTLIR